MEDNSKKDEATAASKVRAYLKVIGTALSPNGDLAGIAIQCRKGRDNILLVPHTVVGHHARAAAESWFIQHNFLDMLSHISVSEILSFLRQGAGKRTVRVLDSAGFHAWIEDGVQRSGYVWNGQFFPFDGTKKPRVLVTTSHGHAALPTTPSSWGNAFAAYLTNNPRLLVPLAAALSAAIRAPFGQLPYVTALVGASSTGKSTIQRAIASVLSPRRATAAWNGTLNGMRDHVSSFIDQPCLLEDMHKADQVADAATLIMDVGNQASRLVSKRARLEPENKPARAMLIVSTEESLFAQQSRSRSVLHSGVSARNFEIHTGEHGMFDDLGKHTDGREFAMQLDALASADHGQPWHDWIQLLSENWERIKRWHTEKIPNVRKKILAAAGDPQLDAITGRLVDSLAFSAFAGCAAAELKLLPISRKHITTAFGMLLAEHLDRRPLGRHELAEAAVEAVRGYIQVHRPDFPPLHTYQDPHRRSGIPGFTTHDKKHGMLYLFFPQVFRTLFEKQYGADIYRYLREADSLVAQPQRQNRFMKRIPARSGEKSERVIFYAIPERILHVPD